MLSKLFVTNVAVHAGFNAEGGSVNFNFSTHSPILMAFPCAEIYELSEDAIRSVRYQDTEHFQVTKQFLNAPEQMIRYLEIGE